MSRRRRNKRAAENDKITFSQDEFEANLDLVECEDCGREFNLGAQTYYGPLCPSCRDNSA